MPRRSSASSEQPNHALLSSLPQPDTNAEPTIRKLFAEVVASMPRTHFKPGDAHLIELYAGAVLLARKARREIDANGPDRAWILAFDRATRVAANLAARLRLT